MRRITEQLAFAQILPLLAAICIVSGNVGFGEEPFSNELGAKSPKDEPQVIIPENPQKVPIRPASGAVLESNDPLVKLVYETREITRQRLLNTKDHTPWQMMHGLLGLRQDFLISHNGETLNGLEWIQTGPMFKNEPWFQKTSHGGRAHPYNHPYWFEGHINQSLAILATCNVPLDAQFGTPQGPITMREMLKNAQMTANSREEVTWTLWALSTYLPSDAEWINEKGERWSIERLVQLETGKQVGGPTSPCGGTHGLFALSRARNVYLKTGKPLRGVWALADQKIQKYIRTVQTQLNNDGSLSSNFFRGRDYKKDFDKRMASNGHLLEFLMVALPQERLKEPWVRKAIEATANDLKNNRKAYVSCSPLYHATNALTIYLERVLPQEQAAAQKPTNTKTISNSQTQPATNSGKISSGATPGKTAENATPGTTGSPAAATPPAVPGAAVNPAVPAVPAPSTNPSPVPDVPATPTPATPAPATTAPATVTPVTPTPDGPVPSPENPLKQVPLPDPASELPPIMPPDVSAASPALVPTPKTDLVTATVPDEDNTSDAVVTLPAEILEVKSLPTSTVVNAPLSREVSGSGTASQGKGEASGVSAEEVPLLAGPAEATSPLLPLSPLIIISAGSTSPASKVPAEASSVKADNAPAIIPAPVSKSESVNETKTADATPSTPGSVPGEKKPDQKRRGEWKLTPLERRRTIVVESPPSV